MAASVEDIQLQTTQMTRTRRSSMKHATSSSWRCDDCKATWRLSPVAYTDCKRGGTRWTRLFRVN